jgi:flagellar biosynthesis protein FliR
MENINIFDAALFQLQIFMLEVIRISSIFLTAPVLGSRNTPTLVKIAFAFLFAMLLYPVLDKNAQLPADTLSYLIIVFNQVLVGVIIGYSAYMIFAAIQLAGQIIDLQMGFGIVNVIDPMSNTQVSIIGQFQFVLGMLIFLSINGHHFLFQAVTDSFRFVPLSHAGLTGVTLTKLGDLFVNLFVIAFKIAGPATLALVLTNVTLGMIARTIPQMNVFIVGLPLNILVGLAAVLISLPILVNLFNTLLSSMWDDIYVIIQSMRV